MKQFRLFLLPIFLLSTSVLPEKASRFSLEYSPFYSFAGRNFLYNVSVARSLTESLEIGATLFQGELQARKELRAGAVPLAGGSSGITFQQYEEDRTDLQFSVFLRYRPFDDSGLYVTGQAGRIGGGEQKYTSLGTIDAKGASAGVPLMDNGIHFAYSGFVGFGPGYRLSFENGLVLGAQWSVLLVQQTAFDVYFRDSPFSSVSTSPAQAVASGAAGPRARR